mgnify:CR=1 FL=1
MRASAHFEARLLLDHRGDEGGIPGAPELKVTHVNLTDGNSEIVIVANDRNATLRTQCLSADPSWDGARRGIGPGTVTDVLHSRHQLGQSRDAVAAAGLVADDLPQALAPVLRGLL